MKRATWGLLLVAVALRLYGLDRLPGINGDEAWLAVQVQHLMRGEPFALRTPTHMFINPLLVGTEAALLAVVPPSGWALRLPIALWGLAGLGLFGVLVRRLWRDDLLALLATVLLATAPLAVAYGHCAWDPSFLFVVSPLVLLSALRLADLPDSRVDRVLLVCGAVACLWVHLTAALLLAVLALGAWKIHVWTRRQIGIALALAFGLVLLLATVGGLSLHALSLLADRPLRFLFQPAAAAQLFALPGLLVTGGRAFGYFVGMPETAVVWAVAGLAALGLTLLAWRLRRAERASDRLLAWSWLLLPLPWWVASGLLLPQAVGRERYVVWVLVLAVVLLVRGLREAPRMLLTVACVFALLSGAWLVAMEQQPWPETVHQTFRTGAAEPKVAVAAALVQQANAATPLRVNVADWWLEHPLRYLLPPDAIIGVALPQPQFSVVWGAAEGKKPLRTLYDRQGRAILSLTQP